MPGTTCSTICDGACVDIQTDNRNCGGCGIACAAVAPSSAACANGRCLVTLAAGQIEPAYPAVYANNLYWTTQSHGWGTVMKVPLEGGAPTTLASNQAGPSNLQVNATGVYWALGYQSIVRAPLEGGAPTTLTSGITYTFDLVADATSLYWALASGGSSSVVKMPLAGGPRTTLATKNHGSARSIAVDATSVYWTDNGSPSEESFVYKVPLEGGTVTTLASGQGIAGGLAVDASNVYWVAWRSATDSVLMRIPKTGGSPSAVVSGPESRNFAVDEANAYWTVGSVVMKAPLTGGTPTTLASGQLRPIHIVVDATSVYWTNTGSQPMRATDGTVMKVSPK
jgi:hypothetical protein